MIDDPREARSLESRFWSKVNKMAGCWEWTACTSVSGYGKFHTLGKRGKVERAHRAA